MPPEIDREAELADGFLDDGAELDIDDDYVADEPDEVEEVIATVGQLFVRALHADGPAPATPCAALGQLFYSGAWADQQEAKALCRGCELRARCLERALRTGGTNRYTDGIQGGYDPQERGFYLRLFGSRVGRVQELPERFLTRKPKPSKGRPGKAAS